MDDRASDRANDRARAAAERVEQLAERLDRMRAGGPPTPADRARRRRDADPEGPSGTDASPH